MPHLALVAIVVRDYDEAIEFYVNKLGFELVEDRQQTADKRWVVVRPRATDDRLPNQTGLLLAKTVGKNSKRPSATKPLGELVCFCRQATLRATINGCRRMASSSSNSRAAKRTGRL